MNAGTSGLLYEDKADGGVEIRIVDYGVEMFGGGDYERFYNLDGENAAKLKNYLSIKHGGSLKEMLIEEYGPDFRVYQFESDCKEQGIIYKVNSWY